MIDNMSKILNNNKYGIHIGIDTIQSIALAIILGKECSEIDNTDKYSISVVIGIFLIWIDITVRYKRG